MSAPAPRVCWHCGKEAPARLGNGWHDFQDKLWCPEIWRESFVLRAVTVPIRGPEDKHGWPALREELKTAWRATTRLANWTVRELAKADVVRTPEMTKLPKAPRLYLYPGAKDVSPELPSASVIAVQHAVEGRYREKRYGLLWTCSESFPTFRYPQPLPVHNKGWSAFFDKGGTPCVSVGLTKGESRTVLRLRSGREFRRQLGDIRQIVEGKAKQGQLEILERSVGGGSHRRQMTSTTQVFVKIVGYFPRREARERDGALVVTTTAESLLVAIGPDSDKLWSIHGDQLKRLEAEVARHSVEHPAQLQRWADDSKMELRHRRRRRLPWRERRERASRKFHDRMNTAAAQLAAMVVGYADRRRYAAVVWMPSDERFVESFCWYRLETEMANRCAALGITFEKRTSAPEENAA